MNHPEIELAIAVVVEPTGGDGPFTAFDAGLGGNVVEAPPAGVAIQNVAIHSRDEKIGTTIVVVIGGGNAHRISRARDSSYLGDVTEFPIAFVAEEAVPVF